MRGLNPSYQPEAVADYLRTVLPFTELPAVAVAELAGQSLVEFHAKGERILSRGEAFPDGAFLIQRGGVRLFTEAAPGEETLVDYRGEGNFVGVLHIMQDIPSECHVEAVEDTFLIRIGKEALLDVLNRHPAAAKFFGSSFAESYFSRVVSDLRRRFEPVRAEDGFYLFARNVGSVVGRRPVTIRRGSTLRQAAGLMVSERVGSLLVREISDEVIGIVTDKDLRRAVAAGIAFDAPVETVMSAPVMGVGEEESCFDALLSMTSNNVRHLTVWGEGAVAGVVTANDLLLAHGRSPMAILRAIRSRDDFPGLYTLAGRLPEMASSLVADGATAGTVSQILTIVADQLIGRVLDLLHKAYGQPPVAYCWLALSASGRGEAVVGSDQRFALLMAEAADPLLTRAGVTYLEAVAAKAAEHLWHCGFTVPEPAAAMGGEANPFALSAFTRRLESLLARPALAGDDADFEHWDFRPVYGERALAAALAGQVAAMARGHAALLGAAGPLTVHRPPLAVFQNELVERDGARTASLDVKGRGMKPLSDMARLLALYHGVGETGTVKRLRRLEAAGVLPRQLARDAAGAFEYLHHLLLLVRLEARGRAAAPRDLIRPSVLSELEKRTLKNSFDAIETLRAFVAEEAEHPEPAGVCP